MARFDIIKALAAKRNGLIMETYAEVSPSGQRFLDDHPIQKHTDLAGKVTQDNNLFNADNMEHGRGFRPKDNHLGTGIDYKTSPTVLPDGEIAKGPVMAHEDLEADDLKKRDKLKKQADGGSLEAKDRLATFKKTKAPANVGAVTEETLQEDDDLRRLLIKRSKLKRRAKNKGGVEILDRLTSVHNSIVNLRGILGTRKRFSQVV
jgi:hypothetical protein